MNETGETPRGLITRVAVLLSQRSQVPLAVPTLWVNNSLVPAAQSGQKRGMDPGSAGNKTPVLSKNSKCLSAEPSLQPQQKHFKLK